MVYSDNEKTKVQREIKDTWYKNNFIGTVILPTGTGKTGAALMSTEDLKSNSILVIVPSIHLQNQWTGILQDMNYTNFNVVVINTAIKNSYVVDTLVIDEVHRCGADEFRKAFEVVKYKKIMCLTATLERGDQKHYIVENHCPVIYKKTVKEALKLNLIPEFIVYNLKVEITSQSERVYSVLDRKFNNFFSFFNFDFDTAMNCLQYENHRLLFAKSIGIDPQTIRIKAINFRRAMSERKDFIYYHPDKLKATVEVVNRFSDKKIIIFAERKSVLEDLKKLIPNSEIYDTSYPKKKLKDIMERYKNNEFKILLTAKALDEGLDVPDIDIGIIHSGNSSKINGKQRVGRLLRKDGTKIPLIINLYLEGTQDEKWLINRGKEIPNTYWITNINEIMYEPGKESLKEENRSDYFNKRVELF
jgi:superfamily II DNA or RNA helicase